MLRFLRNLDLSSFALLRESWPTNIFSFHLLLLLPFTPKGYLANPKIGTFGRYPCSSSTCLFQSIRQKRQSRSST